MVRFSPAQGAEGPGAASDVRVLRRVRRHFPDLGEELTRFLPTGLGEYGMAEESRAETGIADAAEFPRF